MFFHELFQKRSEKVVAKCIDEKHEISLTSSSFRVKRRRRSLVVFSRLSLRKKGPRSCRLCKGRLKKKFYRCEQCKVDFCTSCHDNIVHDTKSSKADVLFCVESNHQSKTIETRFTRLNYPIWFTCDFCNVRQPSSVPFRRCLECNLNFCYDCSQKVSHMELMHNVALDCVEAGHQTYRTTCKDQKYDDGFNCGICMRVFPNNNSSFHRCDQCSVDICSACEMLEGEEEFESSSEYNRSNSNVVAFPVSNFFKGPKDDFDLVFGI